MSQPQLTIILIEHDRGQLKRPTLHAITLAQQLGGEYALLALGHELASLGEALVGLGAKAVLLSDDPSLAHPLADRYATVVAEVARRHGATTIIGSSSSFTKDTLPRVAALLDAPMLTDVLAIETVNGDILFRRPMQAGNLIATVRLDSPIRVLSVRATAFEMPGCREPRSPIERIAVDVASLPAGTEHISAAPKHNGHRPDLCEARVVVAGGRPFHDRQEFDQLIGGLADALGGATASTRAAVDAGVAPNDSQVGQTGRIVAPQLYFAIGVSGAIQHLAGVKDSRIIVAINKDPDAPIFQAASYGLVDDLHHAVPQLIEALKRSA